MNDLNPDNIPVEQMTVGERFLIMTGDPIPRCEWTVISAFFSDVSTAACTGSQYGEELDDAVFCPNCGNRIKFISK